MTHDLVLHRIDVVDHQRAAVLEHRKNNGQSHGGFGGGHHHDEEAVNMSVHLLEFEGECHEGQVHRVEHQLDGHEYRDDVAAEDEAGHSESKKNGAQDQVPAQRDGIRHGQISFLASTIAPTSAIRIKTEVTSNGSR